MKLLMNATLSRLGLFSFSAVQVLRPRVAGCRDVGCGQAGLFQSVNIGGAESTGH
jgi:hypothetical protein